MTELYFPEMRRPQNIPGSYERTGTRGVLTCWLAADGSVVRVGERLAEVRMLGGDGSVGWVAALASGTLWHQAREGEVFNPGAVVGLIE